MLVLVFIEVIADFEEVISLATLNASEIVEDMVLDVFSVSDLTETRGL